MLSKMYTVDEESIESSTCLELAKAIHRIDYGSNNYLHNNKNADLWYDLLEIRRVMEYELCDRLNLTQADTPDCDMSKLIPHCPLGLLMIRKHNWDLEKMCKEYDENNSEN